MKRREVNYSY